MPFHAARVEPDPEVVVDVSEADVGRNVIVIEIQPRHSSVVQLVWDQHDAFVRRQCLYGARTTDTGRNPTAATIGQPEEPPRPRAPLGLAVAVGSRRALIIGIAGQDGSYLAELLLSK